MYYFLPLQCANASYNTVHQGKKCAGQVNISIYVCIFNHLTDINLTLLVVDNPIPVGASFIYSKVDLFIIT